MPHTDLHLLVLPEMGSGRAQKGYRASLALYPGPNGALSPASPPGFVTALTTARSRDVPAECFDERLPRRLPHHGSPGACIYSPPRKLRRSHRAYWSSAANVIFSRLPPHLY